MMTLTQIERERESKSFRRNNQYKKLTSGECEALGLAAQGLNNFKIGRKMFISSHTVKAYMATIYKKLNADNRAHAVYIAVKEGIID